MIYHILKEVGAFILESPSFVPLDLSSSFSHNQLSRIADESRGRGVETERRRKWHTETEADRTIE